MKWWAAVAVTTVALTSASAVRAEGIPVQQLKLDLKGRGALPDWSVIAPSYGRSGNPFASFDVGPGVKQSLNVELSSLSNDARGLESVSLSGQQRFAIDVGALLELITRF